MVRLNNATSGSGTTSVDLYGNWGAANAPIVGMLTIANQSIASMGMVNGYTIQTDAGDIIFQQAVAGAPELDAALERLCR